MRKTRRTRRRRTTLASAEAASVRMARGGGDAARQPASAPRPPPWTSRLVVAGAPVVLVVQPIRRRLDRRSATPSAAVRTWLCFPAPGPGSALPALRLRTAVDAGRAGEEAGVVLPRPPRCRVATPCLACPRSPSIARLPRLWIDLIVCSSARVASCGTRLQLAHSFCCMCCCSMRGSSMCWLSTPTSSPPTAGLRPAPPSPAQTFLRRPLLQRPVCLWRQPRLVQETRGWWNGQPRRRLHAMPTPRGRPRPLCRLLPKRHQMWMAPSDDYDKTSVPTPRTALMDAEARQRRHSASSRD
mmetsp:Transcript_766/g.2200  ORF Transcript_766/g.2200 Transcript_766/m.2200 type:complete len:299 (+) Transcript_766:199-1095(+)